MKGAREGSDEGWTLEKGEREGRSLNWEEPWIPVQFSESLTQDSGESTNTLPIDESHVRQKKPSSTARAMLRGWLGGTQGKCRFNTCRYEKCNSCHQLSTPTAGSLEGRSGWLTPMAAKALVIEFMQVKCT